MQQEIKNLLVLQDRDRRLMRLREELGRIDPERETLAAQASAAQARMDAARQRAMQIESNRKKLELDVEAQKKQIEKYSLQQFQTRKNEEYRALAHEIETCKGNISQIEDQILELMEHAEAAQKDIQAATKENQAVKALVDEKINAIKARENALKTEFGQMEANRAELAGQVSDSIRLRYERLFKSKGNMVVVGIERGVCGGCHMTLQRQIVVQCQGASDIISCPNCSRILYYTSEMDVTPNE